MSTEEFKPAGPGRIDQDATLGEGTHDAQKIQVPDGILSADEFNGWATSLKLRHVTRGTYRTEDASSFLYIKACLGLQRESDVLPALSLVRHLTAAGILHPDTQWGAFKRAEDDFQLFPLSPGLNPVVPGAPIPEFADSRATDTQVLAWCQRVDPSYVLPPPPSSHEVYDEDLEDYIDVFNSSIFDDKAAEGSLIRFLNLTEASNPDNWGWDADGNFYPLDVEVIDLGGKSDEIQAWYGTQQRSVQTQGS